MGKVVKFWMRPQPQRTYFEEDQVDLPIVLVLHGGDADYEVNNVDPPVGGLEDQGPECRIFTNEIKLDRDQGYDEDELDEGHHHQETFNCSFCYNLGLL